MRLDKIFLTWHSAERLQVCIVGAGRLKYKKDSYPEEYEYAQEDSMKKLVVILACASAVVFLSGRATASPGFYIGVEAGSSAPNFTLKSLTDVDFEGERSFMFGAKAGIKFLFFAVEGNVLTSSHDITSIAGIPWESTGVGFTYWGINGKLFLPIPIVQPYFVAGYGNYSVHIDNVGKGSNDGYNVGGGVQVNIGKLGIFGEGRYHNVGVFVRGVGELDISNFTITVGLLYVF